MRELRLEIDQIDRQIIEAIQRRFETVSQIAECKKRNAISIEDSSRVEEVIRNNCEYAKSLGLEPKMIQEIFQSIIEHATAYQRQLT